MVAGLHGVLSVTVARAVEEEVSTNTANVRTPLLNTAENFAMDHLRCPVSATCTSAQVNCMQSNYLLLIDKWTFKTPSNCPRSSDMQFYLGHISKGMRSLCICYIVNRTGRLAFTILFIKSPVNSQPQPSLSSRVDESAHKSLICSLVWYILIF